MMITADGARFFVGIAGNIISMIRFLSPVPTLVNIRKRKAVEEFSPIPYLSTLLNCMLYLFYGLHLVHPHSLFLVTINGIGVLLHTVYLTIFAAYSPRRIRSKVLKILEGEVAFMATVITGVLAGAHTHEKRSLIVGTLCVISGTCMYAAPLSVMRLVVRTKSVEYMPFFLSLTGLLSSACWTAYGLIRFDVFVTIPSGLGVLLGLAQLGLYFYYYGSSPTCSEAAC